MKFSVIAAAVLGGLLSAGAASAASVTYVSVSDDPKTQLVIDDAATPGAFRFSLTTLFGTADYLGLGFNFGGTIPTPADFTLVSATRRDGTAISPDLQLFGDGSVKVGDCGQGCNFNGAGSASLFDYIVRIGSNGGGQDNYVASVEFDLRATGSLADFSQLAFRAQSTVNGSIKSDLVEQPAPVPLPASGLLLLAGLGGLAAARRRKAA